jgi:hypothetical protein
VAASTVASLFLAPQPSPERIFSESIRKLCRTCESMLGLVLLLGVALVLTLLLVRARATAASGKAS